MLNKSASNRRCYPSAFALVELLVAIGICAVLMAFLVPALSNARAVSLSIVCKSNLRQIGLGLQLYAHDYADRFPDSYKLGGSVYRRAIGRKNGADPFSLPETYGLQAVLAEHAYLPDSPSLWMCPAADVIDRSYGNTYAIMLPTDRQANYTSEQRMSLAERDIFLVYDNIANRPYFSGMRRGLSEPIGPFVLPPTEYRLPHSFMIKSRSGGAIANDRRGAINVLFYDSSVGSALYDTDPKNPDGPPDCKIIR